jgi:hypothetical protein
MLHRSQQLQPQSTCNLTHACQAGPLQLFTLLSLQALLIVVGNPSILMQDPNWLALMLSCQQRGAIAGQAMPDLRTAAAEASSASGGYGNYYSSSGSTDDAASQLEHLMASLSIGDRQGGTAAADAADLGLLGLQDFSGLVGEVGAGMVRHE